MQDEALTPVLVLDAGSTLMGEWLGLKSEGKVVVEAMNAMGYDAMAIGPAELYKGLDVLQERAGDAAFPLLSCNLVWQASGEPIFEPYTTIDRGDLTFGIIGVTEQSALAGLDSVIEDAEVREPISSVQATLATVADKVDVVILLSHLGLTRDKELAAQVPGLNVIVGGKTRKVMREPEWVGQAVITQMGYDGEWLGRLDVTMENRLVTEAKTEVLFMRPDVPEHPDIAELVARYRKEYPEPTRAAP